MSRESNAFAYDEEVSDDFIVEYLLTISDQILKYSIRENVVRSPDVFSMMRTYQENYFNFSLRVDDLPSDKKLRLFNYQKNFCLYFKKKDEVLLNVILSTNRMEYPQEIPMLEMLEEYDIDIFKVLISWVVTTRRTNATVLSMIGENYNFFRDLDKSERIELKKYFWETAIKRNSHEPFCDFPAHGDDNVVLFNGVLPLFERYNSLFGMERIESDGWTREDIDVMVDFVKEYRVSPYFISHDLRNKRINGMVEIYRASLESEGTYLAFRDFQKINSYVTWNIPKEVFEDRKFSDFMNKMKLKHGVT